MKRKLRTYISLALLLSLVVQSGVYGLVHVHSHNHSHEAVHVDHHHADHDHGDFHACSHSTNLNNDSETDYAFNVYDLCTSCELLMELDKQSFVSNGTADYAFIAQNYSIEESLKSKHEDKSLLHVQGRAPPRA